MAFLPFFFFAIGPALSYVSRQAQHLCPRGVAAPGQPECAGARRSASAGGAGQRFGCKARPQAYVCSPRCKASQR